jgi:hypothetical protein
MCPTRVAKHKAPRVPRRQRPSVPEAAPDTPVTPPEKIPFQRDEIHAQADLIDKALGPKNTPRNPAGRQIILGYVPRPYFDNFHRRWQRFSCIVAHRRAGKTVAALMDTLHRALKNTTTNGRYAFCGPTHAQIKDVVWAYLKQYTFSLPNTRVNEAELSVTLFNGAQIRLYSLDSTAYDRMRGIFLDGCTIDEYADCDPRAMAEVIRPALSDRQGWLSIIGTAKARDSFYKIYRFATKDPEWFHTRLKYNETNVIAPSEIEQMRKLMGPNEFARELESSFEVEGYDQLVSGATVEEAFTRSVPVDHGQQLVFGLDVARFGDDRTVLIMRRGNHLLDARAWRNNDLMQTAQQVTTLAQRYKPKMIYIDGIGVGGGVVDRMRHLGHTNIEDVNVARKASEPNAFANLRAECYMRMKRWMEDRASIVTEFPLKQEFEDDVSAVTYSYDTKGRIQIDSKEDLKAKGLPSPDISDAVALTFATILPTADVERMMRGGQQTNYTVPMVDPFDDLDF